MSENIVDRINNVSKIKNDLGIMNLRRTGKPADTLLANLLAEVTPVVRRNLEAAIDNQKPGDDAEWPYEAIADFAGTIVAEAVATCAAATEDAIRWHPLFTSRAAALTHDEILRLSYANREIVIEINAKSRAQGR